MSQQIYTIRKAFLVPLGVDALLLCLLFVLSLLPQGSATERGLFAFFFAFALYLFLESLSRRVTLDENGIVIRKFLRKKGVSWNGVTHVGSLSLHNKVYLLLTTVQGFFIISSAYGRFSDLAAEILSRVEPSRVEEEVRPQVGRSPSARGHIALAWGAAALMVAIILMKILSLTA